MKSQLHGMIKKQLGVNNQHNPTVDELSNRAVESQTEVLMVS